MQLSSPLEPTKLSDQSDGVLMDLLATPEGNKAMQEILRRYGPAALGLATRLTGTREDAEEIVQDSMITLWKKADQYEPNLSLRSWLLRIVALKAMQRFRDRGRKTKLKEASRLAKQQLIDESPAESLEQMEANTVLQKALLSLSRSEQQYLSLHFGGGLSASRIGEMLDIPRQTASNRIKGALEELRKKMTAMGVASTLVVSLEENLSDELCNMGHANISTLQQIGENVQLSMTAQQTTSTLPEPSLKWALTIIIPLTGFATGLFFVQSGSRHESPVGTKIEIPDVPSTPSTTKVDLQPETFLPKTWTFESAQKELLPAIGSWEPIPAGDDRPDTLLAHPKSGAGFVLPVSLRQKPVIVELILYRPNSVPGDIYQYFSETTWLSEKLESVTVGYHRDIRIKYRLRHRIKTYIFDNWIVETYNKNTISSVQRFSKPFPGKHLTLELRHWYVEKISIREIPMNEIPNRIRNAQTLLDKTDFQETYTRRPDRLFKGPLHKRTKIIHDTEEENQ